ncbi:hypothetical protein JHK85_034707 [Glycine max]|uniref:RNase H type-1 domain-containing protein n=1 Tax=Glycine max TaxID=3847 RepID=A0A0R0H5T3_SOYBN|nr:hypothetical protein JHK87_033928 [Glycine soja]KAG4980749.1 hypothetical protein JHK85_034707 [Glycine max]KAG4986379.1 hypothetical protein JHK86_034070 [Glycine max]KAH1143388.1 hypothetical protein GYH30_033887 [Glycine max]
MAHFSKLKTWQHRTPNPIEAKASGLIQSLTSLKDLNYQNIDFELDNKVVVDGFDNLSHGLSDFNLILNKCNLVSILRVSSHICNHIPQCISSLTINKMT